jgi:hypothetical protein
VRPLLVQPKSCDELGTLFRADARAKLEQRMHALNGFIADPTTRPVFADASGATGTGGAPSVGAGTGGSSGTAGPGTGAGGSSTGGGADGVNGGGKSSDPPAHSTTTTQVAGVDEADIVKTDGTYLYVLHGGSLAIVDAWPVSSLSLAATTPVEGAPIEMYVTPTSVVVFSNVDPKPVLTAAGLAPKPAIADAYVAGSALAPLKAVVPGASGPMTKITVLALDGTKATVSAEHWFEGTYVSSRRVGGSVRVIVDGVAHGPVPDPTQPKSASELSAIELAGHQAIDAAKAEDFLPIAAKRVNGAIAYAPAACNQFYVPPAATSETGIVRVVELDLATPTETTGVTIVGRADHVYGDRDTIWIAGRPYLDRDVVTASALAPLTKQPDTLSLDATMIHAFDFSKPGAPRYVATGRIDGRVPDQFAMDEKDGALRIATSGQRITPAKALAPDGTKAPLVPDALSHLVVLAPRGTDLVQTGTAGDVAPGDTIRATRFVKDHAFLVTARPTLPLVAIDVSDGTAPTVIGQVDIPGFSEFVQPMDDSHLLTIGRDTASGGTSLALSIFDVRDPKAPAVVEHFVYSGIDGYSAAETNQKAFTYWADRGLLAFPYVGVQAAGGLGGLKSTLEVFRVDASKGFTKIDSIDHGSFFGAAPMGFCGGAYGVDVRRGVFIENTVFSVSYGGIVATSLDGAGMASGLALPPPPCPLRRGHGRGVTASALRVVTAEG